MPSPVILTSRDFDALFEAPDYMKGAIDALERALVADYEGRVRTGAFLDEDASGGGNVRLNLVAGQGNLSSLIAVASGGGVTSRFILLLDGVTRELVALMDSGLLNPLRVGAEGGLAARYLASPGSRVVGVLGSGKQARTQVAALCCALPELELIKVFSPTQEHRESFCREMSAWLGLQIEPAATAQEAIDGADVVDLVNPSHRPLFETAWLKPGALILAISGRGEVPLDFLTGTRVVAPSWEILAHSPVREPFLSAVKAGTYTREDFAAELGEVIVKGINPRVQPSDIVDFEATAMPILEHAATEWAYEWALAAGVGTPFSLKD